MFISSEIWITASYSYSRLVTPELSENEAFVTLQLIKITKNLSKFNIFLYTESL